MFRNAHLRVNAFAGYINTPETVQRKPIAVNVVAKFLRIFQIKILVKRNDFSLVRPCLFYCVTAWFQYKKLRRKNR